jgi:hypothetical protein
MGPTLFTPDPTTIISIPTSSAADSSKTMPQVNSGTMTDNSSWWYLIVAGCDAYIQYNGAALNDGTCAWLPVTQGIPAMPIRIAPGTIVHALGTGAKGQVTLMRAKIGQ